MADDIFLTPEEQDERARKWLKDNGPALIIGVALGLAAIFGYEQYKSNKITQAENASGLYAATLAELGDSSLSNIDAQLNELKEQHSGSSYAAKASLLKAKQLADTDLDAAFTELQWVLDHAEEFGLKHTARLRQAKIKLSQGDLELAKKLASHTPTQGFESNYSEILAEVSLKMGDEAAARDYFQKAIDTLPSSQGSYGRALSLKLDRLPEPAVTSAEQDMAEDNKEGSSVDEAKVEQEPTQDAALKAVEAEVDKKVETAVQQLENQ